MDRIDFVHRVVRVAHPFGLRSRVELAFQTEFFYEERMRIVAVVDQGRSRGDSIFQKAVRPRLRRLRRPFGDYVKGFAVGGRAYRDLVPRYAAKAFAVGGVAHFFVDRDVGLINPNAPGEDDPVLASIQHGKDLPKPIKARCHRVSVVPGRRRHRMEFEEVHQIFDPFRNRDLVGIENGARKRVEPRTAAIAEIFLDAVPPSTVFDEIPRTAMGAVRHGGRIDQRDFLQRRGPVLLGVPFKKRAVHELFAWRKLGLSVGWVRL